MTGKIRMNHSREIAVAATYTNLMRFLFLSILLLMGLALSPNAFAAGGDALWTYNPAVAGKQETKASTVDSQGNTILAGYTEAASSDYYVTKILADGSSLAWPAKTYDKAGGQDIATAVAVDGNDDIIVTGYVHTGSNYDIHTIKYSGTDGSVLWQHTYNGAAGGNDYGNAIAVDSLNNIYVGGTMQAANAKDDFVIIKYVPTGPNPDGTPTWAVPYSGTAGDHDRLTAITAGIDGIAVIGESMNVVDFDFIVAKYTFDGVKSWERRYDDTGNDKGLDVAMDASGNVVATGYSYNGSNFDGFTIKYSAADGTPIWVKQRDGGDNDKNNALWLDDAGNVYVAGFSFTLATNKDLCLTRYAAANGDDTMPAGWQIIYNTNNGNIDDGIDIIGDNAGDLFVTSITNNNAGGFDDIHTYKYSKTNGTQLWQAIQGSGTYHDRPVGIGLAPDGNPVVGGWSDTAATSYDFVAVKYDAGALDAPTGLTATVVSTSEIALSWSDNAGNEENFVVERKSGNGDWGVVIDSLAANTTSYNDTGLDADTRYYYRVKATNTADGSSPYSNEANARTTLISYTPPTWQHLYAGAAGRDDQPAAIAVGPDNHPVVTGFSDAGVNDGGFDYYTIKLDRSNAATEQWSARHNDDDNESDYATAVTVDSSNRVIISGYASMFAIGGDSNTNDVYTIGYPSSGGTPSWNDQYNGPSGQDDRSSAVATAVDGSDNVAVIGYGKNADLNDDIYVIKYNSSGNRLWAATPYDSGGIDQPATVAFDPSGDIFVAGKSWNGSNFDYFVAKYNGSDGSLAWGGTPRIYNGAGNSDDYATDLAVDSDGNLYVTGYSVGAGANGNILTLKYDGATGNVIAGWPQIYDGGGYDIGVAIEIDQNNNDVVVAGTTFIGAGNNDIVVVRYPSTGVSAVWTKTLEFTGSDETAAAMAIDRTGVVCVTGSSGDDILAVMFDYNGMTVGASVFDGVAGGVDFPADVVINTYGEAFVAGTSINADNNTDFIVFKTTATVMQSPYPLTATQLYTQADLTWADNSLDETGFRVERKVDGCADPGSWTAVTETAADTTTYLASGLNPGSTYCFRVQSYNGSGESSRWAEHEVTTAAPVEPDGLDATVQNTTDVLLEWNDHTASETGFTLQRCQGAGCSFAVYTDILIAADATSYLDTEGCEGQVYRYRINANRTGQWVTDYSTATGDVTTDSKQAPSGVATDWVSEEWIELKWSDNSPDETEFRIERCEGLECSDFTSLGTLVSPAGNVLRMRMDEASWPTTAGAVLDSSGAGNNGQAINGATTNSSGKYAYAGYFDGTNDSVAVTSLVLDQSATSPGASFAAWVYPNSVSANNHFVIGTDNGGNDWSLLRNAGTWWVANGSDAALVNTAVAVDAGSWQHLAVTFDPAAGVTLYKNGVSAWSNAAIAFDASTAAIYIGRRGSLNQEFFDGRMDEVAVFTRPLTGAEAQALYDHGLARYNDRTVAHSTSYRYQVRAYKGSSCSWTSDPSTPIERTTTPPAPTNFAATVVDSGRILMSWTDNTTSETNFRIDRCSGSGCVDFAEVATVALDSTSYMDNGLCADPDNSTTYTYKVTAISGTDWSSAAAGPAEATIPALAAPAGLTVTETTEDRISLEWTNASTDLTTLKLARCDGDATICADPGNFGVPADISPEPTGNLMMLHMDEASWSGAASEVVDASGNGKHGTTAGDTASIASGKYIRGGWFDGSNDFITTLLNIDQGGTAAVTFEAWVYPTLNSNTYKYVISTDNGGADWGLSLYGTTWRIDNGTNSYLNTSQTATFNAWQHMVVSFEPGVGVKLYRNGVLIWSHATIGYDAVDYNVTIGRQGSSGNYFTGRIDEVAVYSRALSATEVANRYNRKYVVTETGLPHSSSYRYKLWAEKSSGCAWTANAVTVDTATVAPPVPGSLSVTASQSTQIDLAWDDDATSETGYRIERCPGSGTTCDEDSEFALLVDRPAGSISYSDATVCNGSTFTYRVRTEKDDGPIWQSAWVSGNVTTPAAIVPASFTATGISESEIGLTWDDTTFDEDEFVLKRCTGSGAACDEDGEFTDAVTTIAGTVPGNQLHYRMDEALWTAAAGQVIDSSGNARHGQAYNALTTGMDGKYDRAGYFDGANDWIATTVNLDQDWGGPGATVEAWVYPAVQDTSYHYVFSTENGGNDWGLLTYNGLWYVVTGENLRSTGIAVSLNQWQHVAVAFSPQGAAIRFYKNGVETPLNAAYLGYDTSYNNVTIGRQANSSYYFNGRIDEFAVYNRPLTLSEVQQHYQRQIQIFGHTDTGLTPGTTYTYQVKASRAADCGWSTSAIAEGSTQAPPPPSDFTASAIDTTRIDLAWTDNSGSEDAYHLQRCQGAGCTNYTDLDPLLAENTTSYSDTTINSGQVYRYQVRARKYEETPYWDTAWVGPAEATAVSQVDPVSLTATRAAENQIDLTWNDSNPDETGFVIERCLGSGCSNFTEVATVDASEIGSNRITGANGAVGSFATNVVDLNHPRTGAAIKALQLTHSGTAPVSQSATLNLQTDIQYLVTFDAWTDAGANINLQNDLSPDTLPEFVHSVGPAAKTYRAIFTSSQVDMSSCVLRFFHYNSGRTIYVTNISLKQLTYPVSYTDIDSGLAPGTTYSYQVKAVKAVVPAEFSWDSGYTNSAEATTTVASPNGLTASAVDTTSIGLSWTDNTSTETDTLIERCTGTGCSSFAQIASVGPGVTSYPDTSVANGTSYSYQVKTVNRGLSDAGGASWTRSKPLSFTAFTANQTYEIVVLYDADMRSDFGDLRFYDETAKKQLPYWIRTKTDSVSATVRFQTRTSNTINLYYGNPSATDAGNENELIDIYTFAGTVIDTNKWVEIDPSGGIAQNNDLILNDVTDAWTMALISKTTYPRTAGRELYIDLSIPADTAGNNNFMAGWDLNQTANASYTQLVHGLYWNNYAFGSYEKGGSTGGTGTYVASTNYQMKVVFKALGAQYYVRGGAYADWTLIKETSTYSDTNLRIALHQYSHQARIHRITVAPGVSVITGASLGTEQSSGGYTYDFAWSSGYSNIATEVTPAKEAPSALVAEAVTDSQIDLTWVDETDDETGFKIERCTGSGCSSFVQIDTVPTNVITYSDTGRDPSTIYNYRVRTYKTATQSWDSAYSNEAEDLVFTQQSSGLTATALNSRMIRLDWEDNGSDEEGFEIEVKVWNGRFIKTATVAANVTTYTDHVGIEENTDYVYRVRTYRGEDKAPYSNEAPVTSLAFEIGDNTCLP